jgi:pyridoxamine 5'-phosphate oxidase
MDLSNFRREYQAGGLCREDLPANPIQQFEGWLNELLKLDTLDPTAMVLATVDAQQQASQRIVLLKKVDEQGFVFFTNRDSAKGEDIAINPKVSLHFPWHYISRQVSIIGDIVWTSPEEDSKYFAERPQQSQWAAWASAQSQPLSSRQDLLDKFEAMQAEYPNNVPLPSFWGGYRVVPKQIEFWQGRDNRLLDRFVYTRGDANEWSIERLSP